MCQINKITEQIIVDIGRDQRARNQRPYMYQRRNSSIFTMLTCHYERDMFMPPLLPLSRVELPVISTGVAHSSVQSPPSPRSHRVSINKSQEQVKASSSVNCPSKRGFTSRGAEETNIIEPEYRYSIVRTVASQQQIKFM